jgi:hypothetical protein
MKISAKEATLVAGVLVLLVGISLLGVAASRVTPTLMQVGGSDPYAPRPVPPKPEPVPEEPTGDEPMDYVSEGMCNAAGGDWNECGSACRGAPEGTACILMCVTYCECTSDAQCPDGFSCGSFIDGVGVCAKTESSS